MLSLADSLQPCFLPGSVLTRAALLSLANLQASAAPLSSERGIGGDETCRAVTGQPPAAIFLAECGCAGMMRAAFALQVLAG